MIEGVLRKHYQRICIDPLLRKKWLLKLSPTKVTALATLSGLTAALCIALGFKLPSIALLLFSGYLDSLDGALARFFNRTSPLGTVFDIVSDRLVEFATLFSLYFVAPNERAALTILMLGSILLCVTSFLVVGIFTPNHSEKSFHYSAGLIERAEAFIFFTLMILFPGIFFLLSIVFCLLVQITTVIRLLEFAKRSL